LLFVVVEAAAVIGAWYILLTTNSCHSCLPPRARVSRTTRPVCAVSCRRQTWV